jgi:hypothetical protein
MPTAANPQSTANPWQGPGWQSPWGRPWSDQTASQPPFWHPAGMGRPIAIAALVFLLAAGHLGRMLFWPLGLAALVYMIASGRSRRRCWGPANWAQQAQGNGPQGGGWQSCMPSWANWGGNWGSNGGGGNRDKPPTSGNHAFDEYRAETLRRLEEEQSEFSSFLERLRFAKDKAEFDQFMAERRRTPPAPPASDEAAHG